MGSLSLLHVTVVSGSRGLLSCSSVRSDGGAVAIRRHVIGFVKASANIVFVGTSVGDIVADCVLEFRGIHKVINLFDCCPASQSHSVYVIYALVIEARFAMACCG